MQIPGIQPISISGAAGAVLPTRPSDATSQVGETFSQMLDSLNQSQLDSDNLVQQMASGGDVDLHQVMIGMEENDVNFKVAMAIRDRLVDAYREVMRMSV
jgi:flagellar hook-basal body complex protein FliE